MSDSFRASLDYLYSLQLFGIKLGLENIRKLLERLDNPQRQLRIIHIAGTNGKGSTAAALANVFQVAGIRTGLYTSPHLHSFTERVRVATQQIDEAEVVRLTDEIRPHAEELRTTFFEFTTALALLHFQRNGCQWAILETGMGGRLDATNAVEPELCLITPIAQDHGAYLGETLAQVAAEKAGIFKPDVPVISSRQQPEVWPVLQRRADEVGTDLLRAESDYDWTAAEETLSFRGFGCELNALRPQLQGRHQQQNLALALAAVSWLRNAGVALPEAAMRQGVEQTRWPGRLEWLPDDVLLDGAHNAAGAQVLADYLAEKKLRDLHLVVGLKADKQAAELLAPLLPFVRRLYATRPPVDEAVSPEFLVKLATQADVSAAAYDDPKMALQAARQQRQKGEILLVAGSLFLVAALREMLLPETELLSISS
ncbi:dihydrofolate synthase / folylpolyglutamate synthase [Malonomonas rubra DSM 5091]|uniref:Dihydrofolate synthase/folylpolyglutamate synthase n=1 Tax=Malonomonas rubra DSM 5091 TaxID=1122189 RepID=A0A1M6F1V0_MALRU|nr:folylpolyglutamate synthase/dihydrofolate synthase family protein [Malonomonas rubra]SHI91677.1 dihydrofolate synthase / folylpolyglutamate synthase [Malonomonas rubra DSM 5091]